MDTKTSGRSNIEKNGFINTDCTPMRGRVCNPCVCIFIFFTGHLIIIFKISVNRKSTHSCKENTLFTKLDILGIDTILNLVWPNRNISAIAVGRSGNKTESKITNM
jgi:hypothetical protein